MLELVISQDETWHRYSFHEENIEESSSDISKSHLSSSREAPALTIRFRRLPNIASASSQAEAPNTIAQFVWPAALILAAVLIRLREDIAGKRCLELGSGVGFVSMVAIGLGARKVVATDSTPACMELDVISGENETEECGNKFNRLDISQLTWGVFTREALQICKEEVDIVLGSDVLYNDCGADSIQEQDALDAFLATLSVIRSHSRCMRCIISVVNRSDRHLESVKSALEAWQFQVVEIYKAEDVLRVRADLSLGDIEVWVIQ